MFVLTLPAHCARFFCTVVVDGKLNRTICDSTKWQRPEVDDDAREGWVLIKLSRPSAYPVDRRSVESRTVSTADISCKILVAH